MTAQSLKTALKTEALIFDMDGTMINSMPYHAQSWIEFTRNHGIQIDVPDLMARTTGRTGAECMRELFQRDMEEAECWRLIHEKEEIYRELFAPVFSEVAGFKAFAAVARGQGLKVGVGTAGDKHNIAFAFSHLKMDPVPHAVVGGDEGLPGKPEPALFLEAARRLAAKASSRTARRKTSCRRSWGSSSRGRRTWWRSTPRSTTSSKARETR